MMKNTIISYKILGLLILSTTSLTACQRQESSGNQASVATPPQLVEHPAPLTVTPQTTHSANKVDNPAVRDLLDRVVRSDIPSMTYDQVKALFPKNCIANDDRNISCPGVDGLISIVYGGGPDGMLDMKFSGGMASCLTLKAIISKKFGDSEDNKIDDKDINASCGAYWPKISIKNKTYHAALIKIKGDDQVSFQIGAEQGP